MKQMLALAGVALLVASCNTNYEKTASGLAYKIFKGEDKQKLKTGDIVKINASIKVTPKDTILFTTAGHMPEYIPLDTTTRSTHDFNEVLKLCSVGDSLIVVSQVDTLVKRGMAQYNEMFKRGDQIVTTLKVLKALSREEQPKDQQAEMEKEKAKEVAQLDSYLKKKGIKAQKTENGAFIEILNPGSAEKVVPGKQVSINYKGALLENGKVFDSNIDTSFHHTDPYTFVLGAGQSIRGLEEGVLMLGKGGKGNIYVPSLLGYGPPGAPPAIPGYASLKFEVEVTDVTNAPPMQQGGMPGMPGGDPRDPRNQQDPRTQQDPRQQQDPRAQQDPRQQQPPR
jgi:FKBP-type peptidyl-prolyl cis-trans isomerase